jgi:hypothetical protein
VWAILVVVRAGGYSAWRLYDRHQADPATDAQTVIDCCVSSKRCAVAAMIDGTIKVMTEEEPHAAIPKDEQR